MQAMTLTYLAGFFDGEGCIRVSGRGMHVVLPQNGERGRRLLEEVRLFLLELGVKASLYPPRGKTNPGWILGIYSREGIQRFGAALLPYLKIKKTEVEDILRFMVVFPAIQHNQQGPLIREGKAAAKTRRQNPTLNTS